MEPVLFRDAPDGDEVRFDEPPSHIAASVDHRPDHADEADDSDRPTTADVTWS